MKKIGRIIICLSVCVLEVTCVQVEEKPVRTSASAITSETIAQGNANAPSEYQSDMDIETEIEISDILIPEIPYLAETPFMVADIDHVLAYDSELEKNEGYEGGNGHFNYWKGDGIEYVTHSSGKNLAGIVINSSDYSLANNIRVGMTELELIQAGYPFKKCNSEVDNGIEMMILGSGLLRDEKGPLNMTHYDYIYAYVGSASADEIKNYGIDGTSCYSIVLLMKDGVIDKVILDLPTAG